MKSAERGERLEVDYRCAKAFVVDQLGKFVRLPSSLREPDARLRTNFADMIHSLMTSLIKTCPFDDDLICKQCWDLSERIF